MSFRDEYFFDAAMCTLPALPSGIWYAPTGDGPAQKHRFPPEIQWFAATTDNWRISPPNSLPRKEHPTRHQAAPFLHPSRLGPGRCFLISRLLVGVATSQLATFKLRHGQATLRLQLPSRTNQEVAFCVMVTAFCIGLHGDQSRAQAPSIAYAAHVHHSQPCFASI